jgi:hypothetical protein
MISNLTIPKISLVKNLFNGQLTPVNKYFFSSQKIKRNEIRQRVNLYSRYDHKVKSYKGFQFNSDDLLTIYTGSGYIELVNQFLNFSTKRGVTQSPKLYRIKELAKGLTDSGKLANVIITFNGRIKGVDRKGSLVLKYNNASVDSTFTKTFKISFTRSKYGMIGGTIIIKSPTNLSNRITY